MYDSLLEQDPFAEEMKVKGEVLGLQKMALEAVKDSYPSLMGLAQERVALIGKPDALRQLVILIFKAPDEATVHWLLNTFVA